MLCLSCQMILQRPEVTWKPSCPQKPNFWPGPLQHYEHSKFTTSVLEACRKGCDVCLMLRRFFDAEPGNQPADELNLKYMLHICPPPEPTTQLNFYYTVLDGCRQIELKLEILEENVWMGHISGNIQPADEIREGPRTSTSSEQRSEKAMTWLNTCLTSHAQCNARPSETEWWPSRLIEIADLNSDFVVRLIETASSPVSGPFVTLSHCWGTIEFLRLTIGNREELKAGFMISRLPRTFREAIVVAKKLECKYIWIDSLCIMQDSLEDWQKEATLMSDVYQNALCNIAATHASDSSKGLFYDGFEPRPIIIQVLQTTSPKYPPSKSRIKRDTCLNTVHILDPSLWLNMIERSPLCKRGWVVQERLLARRVIHFAKGELFWECRQTHACETYPDDMPGMVSSQAVHKDLVRNFPPDQQVSHASAWGSILARYSNAQLTKLEDKEVALFGMIKVLEERFEDKYVAGLWVSALVDQLLWTPRLAPTARLPNDGIPSWSWLAYSGEIAAAKPKYGREICTIDLEDFSIRRKGPSPVSPILAGFLKLRGMLNPVTIYWTPPGGWGTDLSMDIRGPSQPPIGLMVVYGRLDCLTRHSSLAGEYFCVMISLQGDDLYAQGLILELVSQGMYKRIGTWESRVKKQALRLVSKRRQRLFQKPNVFKSKAQPYEEFPYEVQYSPDGCETRISRQASTRELQEREADTEEVVFTII